MAAAAMVGAGTIPLRIGTLKQTSLMKVLRIRPMLLASFRFGQRHWRRAVGPARHTDEKKPGHPFGR
jgi:hypothetical protein